MWVFRLFRTICHDRINVINEDISTTAYIFEGCTLEVVKHSDFFERLCACLFVSLLLRICRFDMCSVLSNQNVNGALFPGKVEMRLTALGSRVE